MEPRAYQSGAAGTPPELTSDYTTGYPQTASATVVATEPGAYFFYGWGEEIRNAELQGEVVPDPYNHTQLLQAILNIAARIG